MILGAPPAFDPASPADPGSLLSNLPDGAGPVTTIAVAVCGVLAVAIPVLGRLIPDRSKVGGSDDVDKVEARLERLETELREAKAEVKRIQDRYEAEKERSHDLEMQLAAAHQRLERADDELSGLRAQLDVVLRPLHVDPYRAWGSRWPERPGPPRRQPSRPAVVPDPDEAPTDPIRGAGL